LRAYSASSEEALRARDLLKDWVREGFLTEAQYQGVEPETVVDLRRTNIFLRLVLFLFTLIIVGAAVGLFFVVLSPSATQTTGILLLIFAAGSYAAAELAVSQARLYRYGIEEALAACAVGFLCAGMQAAFFSGQAYQPVYAPLAAMIFVLFLPDSWTSSHSVHHLIVAAFYAVGLFLVAALRSRHRFTYLNDRYSIAEALLWLGIYLVINLQVVINLQLLPVNLFGPVSRVATAEFSRPFYWTTWVLTWCLPPLIITRGLRQKDRFVIAVGAIVSILTLITNKPYLGWQRHTWDPMLLGALLIGVVLFLRRWLAAGPGEVRRGFTARRLSGKDHTWMSAAAVALVSPNIVKPIPQTSSPDVRFGGGKSGGGGATSDF